MWWEGAACRALAELGGEHAVQEASGELSFYLLPSTSLLLSALVHASNLTQHFNAGVKSFVSWALAMERPLVRVEIPP